ncbi:aminopeptidase P N-terminal domain-containing protein, partial [Craterilacuibacter sp.]|uniref:aminopeptidase P N-terminal domain-containing protein n=1 Tax=Craterilacuibacter sp. TaxID=2870909 RepID=UPI003F35D876
MFAAEIYSGRRERLAASGLSGLVVFLGNVDAPMNYAHNPYHFVQDASFRYFFGLDMQALAGVLDLDAGEVALYGNEPDVADIVWTGPVPSLAERAATAGVTTTRPYAALADAMRAAHAAGRPVHYLQPYRGETVLELARLLACSSDAIKPGFSEALTHAVVA